MIEYKASVVSNVKHGADFFVISLKLDRSIPQSIAAGQFAMIGAIPKEGVLLRRPYSVFDFSKSKQSPLVKFFYKVVGRGTRHLRLVKRGEILSVMLPLGKGFDMQVARGGYVFIVTGGIGVAPFYLFLKQLKKYNPRKVVVFYGAKTRKELFFADNFVKNSSKVFISTDDGTRGHRGFVSDLFSEKFKQEIDCGLPLNEVSVFTCGPKGMMRKIASLCEQVDVRCQVSMEEVMGCGFGACFSCAIKRRMTNGDYLFACKDGPVFDSRMIQI